LAGVISRNGFLFVKYGRPCLVCATSKHSTARVANNDEASFSKVLEMVRDSLGTRR
jgi:hypothetical protein